MTLEESSNITQTLTSLFEEMLLASDLENENRSNVDLSQFLSALKEQSSKNASHEPLDFGTLVKLVDGWRHKLNLTKTAEAACNYCDGNFRDLILAYNNIHGFISLIILVAISFFATGSYQRLVGSSLGTPMAQQSVSRAIKDVTAALNSSEILQKYIKFPQTQEERDNVKRRFYEKFFIPAVVGCIDGTHVAIVRPTDNEERFFNRKHFHSRNVLIVCFFGSFANALNVAVLTRRDLAAAPINRLLKWLAVADVFVMMEYVPFAIYRYLILPGQREMPYHWAAYLLFHMHFTQIFHTASICLTLSLAVWRYVAIKYSDRNHILCTERRCSTAILSSFILPPILCIPTFMVFDIHTTVILEPSGPMILYHVDADQEGQLYQINFWVHAVLIKLLPCCILTVISLWLIREVYSANQHQKKVRVYNACPTTNKTAKRQCKADRRTNRTTKMLVAVLLLFLVTELPQGILGLMSGLLGRCFFKRCYDLFGELMDALALLNGAINFVLYCSMSRQFRMTFGQLMWRAHLHKWPPPNASHSDGQNTAKSSVP